MNREKRLITEFQKTHRIALDILNDAVIFERMNKGFHYMQGAFDPDNTYHSKDPESQYRGCGILSTLMLKKDESMFEDEIIEIFDKHLKQDFDKQVSRRRTSKELAERILLDYECKILDLREFKEVSVKTVSENQNLISPEARMQINSDLKTINQ